jgi:uncharacterized protein YkwD
VTTPPRTTSEDAVRPPARRTGAHRPTAGLRLLVVLLATACALVGLPATAGHAATSTEAQFLSLVNKERSSRGLPALALSPVISDHVSRPWSGSMARAGTLSHSGGLFASVARHYPASSIVGENVGYSTGVTQLHAALMASPRHRENILRPAYRYIGLGAVQSGSRLWLTQTFFQTTNHVPTSTPGAAAPPVDPATLAQTQRYVTALYADFLGRRPDPAGLAHWTGQLTSQRMSRVQVARALAGSDEWLTKVLTDHYRATLGRDPDPAGRADWLRRMRAGMPEADVAAHLYASQEYYQRVGGTPPSLPTWVRDLYRKQLGREADPVGLSSWVTVAQQRGRLAVTPAFYGSHETVQRRVQNLYRTLLGRPADPAGLSTWPPVVRAQGDLALAAFLASSQEYWNRAQAR